MLQAVIKTLFRQALDQYLAQRARQPQSAS